MNIYDIDDDEDVHMKRATLSEFKEYLNSLDLDFSGANSFENQGPLDCYANDSGMSVTELINGFTEQKGDKTFGVAISYDGTVCYVIDNVTDDEAQEAYDKIESKYRDNLDKLLDELGSVFAFCIQEY